MKHKFLNYQFFFICVKELYMQMCQNIVIFYVVVNRVTLECFLLNMFLGYNLIIDGILTTDISYSEN